MLSKREALLGEDAKDLQDQREEIAQLKLEAERVLGEARDEAKKIKDLATLEAQGVYEEKLNRSKAEIGNRFLNAQRELAQKREQIKEELSRNAGVFQAEVREKFLALGGCK